MEKKEHAPILYREIKPISDLTRVVACYWQFEYFPEDQKQILNHSVLPDGCASLVFILSPSIPQPILVLTGPSTELFKTQVEPNSVFIGIRFLPTAFEPIFKVSPTTIRGQNLPAFPYLNQLDLSAIFPKLQKGFSAFDLLNQVLKQYFLDHPLVIDTAIDKAISLALSHEGNIKVKAMAEAVHLSIRQFQRRFKYVTGLTPKEFLKIRRLRSSAIQLLLEQKDYQDVLFQSGYFDQAHFIHDFSMVAGTNPTLFGEYIAKIEHDGLKG